MKTAHTTNVMVYWGDGGGSAEVYLQGGDYCSEVLYISEQDLIKLGINRPVEPVQVGDILICTTNGPDDTFIVVGISDTIRIRSVFTDKQFTLSQKTRVNYKKIGIVS